MLNQDKYRFTYHKPFMPTCKDTAAEAQHFPFTAYAADKYFPSFSSLLPSTFLFPLPPYSFTSPAFCYFVNVLFHRIEWYLGECNGALDLLQVERRDILNGKKKREMTDWYLFLLLLFSSQTFLVSSSFLLVSSL